jgi:hypothetical protein
MLNTGMAGVVIAECNDIGSSMLGILLWNPDFLTQSSDGRSTNRRKSAVGALTPIYATLLLAACIFLLTVDKLRVRRLRTF